MKKISSIFLSLFLLIFLAAGITSPAFAADVRGGQTIVISENEEGLSDLYLFGNTIVVNAPVTNDVVAAGGNIDIDNSVSGNIMAAGGSLRITGPVQGSVRVAGGDIFIDGTIDRDLVLAGGNITISKTASIAGDLIASGGQIKLLGNVKGRAQVNGGNIHVNGKIDKELKGEIERLSFGPDAVIGGGIDYSSPQKAAIEDNAQIKGKQQYNPVKRVEGSKELPSNFLAGFSIYKLIVDVVISLILIYFFGGFLTRIFNNEFVKSPLKNGVYGLAFLILTPIVSIFLFALIWLGIFSFVSYFLIILVSVYIAKIFIGWFILRWWYNRDKKTYVLDWRSAITGPLAVFLISLVPVLGWLFLAVIYLLSIGSFIHALIIGANSQKLTAVKSIPSKK